MKFIFAILPILLLAGAAHGASSVEQEFTCPIDGTVWNQRIEVAGKVRGLRLDLRQLGDVVDPPTLPQCPKCCFPLFSAHLGQPVLDRLKPFVMSADFQFLARKNPSYFSLAQVQEFLHAPDRHIALSYLRASWQVEDRAALNRRLLEQARQHFVAALADAAAGRSEELALLCGEVERRLERWDDAAARFRELESSGRLKGTPQAPILALQLSLLGKRDSGPRALDAGALASRSESAAVGASGEEAAPLWEALRLGDGHEGGLRLGAPPSSMDPSPNRTESIRPLVPGIKR